MSCRFKEAKGFSGSCLEFIDKLLQKAEDKIENRNLKGFENREGLVGYEAQECIECYGRSTIDYHTKEEWDLYGKMEIRLNHVYSERNRIEMERKIEDLAMKNYVIHGGSTAAHLEQEFRYQIRLLNNRLEKRKYTEFRKVEAIRYCTERINADNAPEPDLAIFGEYRYHLRNGWDLNITGAKEEEVIVRTIEFEKKLHEQKMERKNY